MGRVKHYLIAGCVALAATAAAAVAQEGRVVPYTGAIPPIVAAPPWSGLSGASGDPTMTAEAIRAAAANFHVCLTQLWPQAAKRGVARATFLKYTASLTPDLRIMDLLDNQPEFTRSVWDYLDLLVNEARIEKGRAFLARDLKILLHSLVILLKFQI